MYSPEHIYYIWSLAEFLGIPPGEHWPRRRYPNLTAKAPDQDDDSPNLCVFYWRYDPETRQVIYRPANLAENEEPNG